MDSPGYEERKPLVAAAAERNKEDILNALKGFIPNEPISVLEISSGTGQHVAHFAQSLTKVQWQPSDIDPTYISSISAFIKTLGLSNVKEPVIGDVMKPASEWASAVSEKRNDFDVVLCANMIHIAPWSCCLGLFACARYLVKPAGLLITYGPYSVDGVLTPQSNINFNQYLKNENPEWGVRDMRDVIEVGKNHGFLFQRHIDMPANNKMLIFKNVNEYYK